MATKLKKEMLGVKVPIQTVLPFEFRSLEACLESARRCLECEVRDELEHLLDDDSDMAGMYLTEKPAARAGDQISTIGEV